MKKPHLHVLQSESEIVAVVMVWAYAKRNVVFPIFFLVEEDWPPIIGEWICPIMEDLFDDDRPLYLRSKSGHEHLVDKDESQKNFLF